MLSLADGYGIGGEVKQMNTFRIGDHIKSTREQLVGNVKIYKDIGHATREFHSGKPFSGIKILHNGTVDFGVLFYHKGCNKGSHVRVKLIDRSAGVAEHNGLCYWKWRLSVDDTNEFEDVSQMNIIDYAVLLPRMAASGSPGWYTIVTKEWSPEMFGHLLWYAFSRSGMNE